MNRVRGGWAVLCVLLFGQVACGESRKATPPTSGATNPYSQPAIKHILIVNQTGNDEFAFKPKVVTIRPGTKVIWVNRSAQPHTVTQKGEHITFNSGTKNLINPKHSFSVVFHRAGSYTYYCLLHPYMTGTVVVR